MKVIGFWVGVVVCILLGQILEGGHIGSVVQLTSAVIVLGPVLTYLIYSYGPGGFFSFWKRVFGESLTENDVSTINNASLIGMLTGATGCILGMIHVMENLADTSKLGAGIAVAFVSAFYGLLPSLLLIPVKSTQAKGERQIGLVDKKAAGFYAAFVALFLSGSFFVILYACSGHA